MTKKELLSSPHRDWNNVSVRYTDILFMSTGKKHESGFACIAILGKTASGYELIHDGADDISTDFPMLNLSSQKFPKVRMDCLYPSGAFRYHGSGVFKVSYPTSSMHIEFIPAKFNDK